MKHGLLINFDVTEDDQIKVSAIEDYAMLFAERKFTLIKDDKETGNESEFTEVDSYTFNLILSPSQICFIKILSFTKK